MIYFDLILGFLKVGCFAFGGAYGAIPLIRDVVLNYGWLTDEELTYMIKYQNAYNAASRFINVVNEMIEHLLTQLG